MLKSLEEAVSEAETRVTIARAYEADVADQAKARQILETLGAFREAGAELDDACNTLAETGRLVTSLVQHLHGAGIRTPSFEQLDVFGFQCLQTMLSNSVWSKRFRPIEPHSRRSFRVLVDGWAQSIEVRIKAQLGESNDKAA